jgi:hypothetical protein
MRQCIICGKQLPPDHLGVTCSIQCHELYISLLETKFGKYKKVTDAVTGISYRVPTRYIIENGLKQEELTRFPVWTEEKAS